jgi:hypothetical protein
MPTFGGIVVGTGAEASGRRTLLDVVDELSRPINATDTTIRSLAADAFRAAVRTMNRRGCWPWEYQEEDVALTSGARFSSVTSAIKKPLSMHYLDAVGGTEDQRLPYIPYDVFRERYTMDIDSEPQYYTIPNLFETGQIRWYPVPNAADNARFAFWRVTPAPRAEQETIEVPDFATEVYMALAWFEFLKRLPTQQQPFPIALALSEAKQAFKEISAHVSDPGDRSRER